MPRRLEPLDKLDRRIISVLQEDARLTNSELGKRAGCSEATARRRIDRLVKKSLIRIVAVATPFDLGYPVVAILGITLDHSALPQVAAALVSRPEVRFAAATSGPYDLVVEVWFASVEDLLSFLSERLMTIDGIHRAESMQVLKLLKYSYDWGVQPSAALRVGRAKRGQHGPASQGSRRHPSSTTANKPPTTHRRGAK